MKLISLVSLILSCVHPTELEVRTAYQLCQERVNFYLTIEGLNPKTEVIDFLCMTPIPYNGKYNDWTLNKEEVLRAYTFLNQQKP